MNRPLTIGTRGSALALWQAHHVKARLEAAQPGLEVRLEIIKTTGDKILDVPLAKVGGKGLFVKEIEEALLAERVDLAVHSMKDVPADLPAGLCLAAFSAREDPRDALVTRDERGFRDLAHGARVGTSSLRRMAQLRAARPDLVIEPLRGNVDTRLRKLDAGDYDAIVLAAAGLRRLGYGARIAECFEADVMLPAIAQGVLGIEIRERDDEVRALIQVLHDEHAAACVRAERAFLRALGGGCQVPIAGHATREGDVLHLEGLVAWPDSGVSIRGSVHGPAGDASALGESLANDLRARGAGELLAALTSTPLPPPAGSLPLLGRRVLVTRAEEQSLTMFESLKGFGAEPVAFPTIETVPPARYDELDAALHALPTFNDLVFTSPNGVRYFMERLLALGYDARRAEGVRTACIGPGTANAARAAGLRADIVATEFRAEGLVRTMVEAGVRGHRVLVARAEQARAILLDSLREAGAEVHLAVTYRTVIPDDARTRAAALLNTHLDALTFTSASTVQHFCDILGDDVARTLAARTLVACIGPITRDAAIARGLRCDLMPADYTPEALVNALARHFADAPQAARGATAPD